MSGTPDEEAVITFGEDRDGVVLELNAALWSSDGLAMALRSVLDRSGDDVSIWIDHPSEETDALLVRLGFEIQRDLFRMERSLPIEQRTQQKKRSSKAKRLLVVLVVFTALGAAGWYAWSSGLV